MYFRLSSALDFINLLSYDLHGQWEPVTGHHTALYPGSTDVGDNAFLTVVSDSKSVENLSNFTELISTQKSLQATHNNSASVRTKEKKKKKESNYSSSYSCAICDWYPTLVLLSRKTLPLFVLAL